MTTRIDPARETEARDIIGKTEAGADISPAREAPSLAHPLDVPGILRISSAGLLFLGGSIFHGALHATPLSWAEWAVLLPAYLLVGFPVLWSAARNIIRGKVFNETFLMALATGGAIAIHQVPEAVGVMLFYAIGEFLQDLAVGKSRKSISALMALRPAFARVVDGEKRRELPPEEVSPGTLIEVLPGERIPLDATVTEGSTTMDTSSLTGEPLPREASPGTRILSGFVNGGGRILARVDAEFSKSSAARILELVEEAASKKAPTEKFISKFASVYTPVVVISAALVAFLPPLLLPGAALGDWVYRALVLLVISCPCALVVSIPLGYYGGLGAASRAKVLVKGAECLDALKDVDTVVFDKTGTLTEGVFAVTETVSANGYSSAELLSWAAAAENHSTHPIAASIREAAGGNAPSASATEEIKGYGVIATVGGREIIVGNDRILHLRDIDHPLCDVPGTVTHVAVDGKYAGRIILSDRLKAGAAEAIASLRTAGVRRVVMLTGDGQAAAERIAAGLGLDEIRAELLPEDKVAVLEEISASMNPRRKIAFVGDGMNDAPVLMRADVGIAMGGLGSDAAVEAADAVIMDDRPERVAQAIGIAKRTRAIVVQNIALALAVKAVFIALGSIGVAGMWEAVIGDVGVSLLAVLNAMRAMRA